MYERTSTIEREAAKPVANTGEVSGILATSGEASDGHILNIEGGETKRGAPLLFNHDALDGNLGSWVRFERSDGVLRGTAQIELDGIGEKAAWRNDVAFMVDQGHIPGFSLRWDAVKSPTRRVDLAKDHPAYVNAERETDFSKLYGLYFDKWRMMEGSIVTLPSDQGALIGRMRDANANARSAWKRVLDRMAGVTSDHDAPERDAFSREVLASFEGFELTELEPVEMSDGRTFYLPAELAELCTPPPERAEEATQDAAPLEVEKSETPAQPSEDASASNLEREDLFELMKEEVAPMYAQIREEWRELLYQAVGKV